MSEARRMLDLAARVARRAEGLVEPNPMVGCVIVRPRSRASAPAAGEGGESEIIGIGHHRVFGGAHAEVEALADCRRRGHDPRGATMFVTLEPCVHRGKTPPCVDAVIAAGIARVVAARRDPNPVSGGGLERLRAAGIAAEVCADSRAATELSDPFVKRVATGLPWVIVKWAQTIDGRVATRAGQSKWISGAAARRRVHRWRARVDAVVTGIGSVLADDPMLTARDVRRVRRHARRVVIDPRLEIPVDCALVRSSREGLGVPAGRRACVTVATGVGAASSALHTTKRRVLEAAGVEVLALPTIDEAGHVDLRALLADLAHERRAPGATNVLVEAGPRLAGAFLDADLADELRVHIAPMLLADAEALGAATGRAVPELSGALRFSLGALRRAGADAELIYRRRPAV